MPFHSWLLIAAIGLTISGSLQAQEQPSANASNQEELTDGSVFAIPVELVESQEATATRESEEAERRQREIDDLIAQQGMNDATQAMNTATQSMMLASWLSAALGGLGTILLVWTLRLTREANKAARDAVNITDRAALDQLRPWISVGGLNHATAVDAILDGVQYPILHGFSTTCTNHGQSPAVKVSFASEYRMIPKSGETPTFQDISSPSDATIMPGGKLRTQWLFLTPSEWDRFEGGEVDLIFHVKTIYTEILRPSSKRFTQTTYRSAHNGRTKEQDGKEHPRLETWVEGPQNKST
ncbi:hypothetical protein [uncultured Sulfitobacter sp.]|uniref:hypothetical protein n=1 Tax=uncultured Sulfitobacter sp. TaxID=191468 RepID=UPI0030D6D50C|tara:strand:+ start:2353 stop:3246 length:894 start_codon:yes stop_codon:yes gene_type:complete